MNIKRLGKDYEELIKLLDTVPGVKEHINNIEVKTGILLLKRRIELMMTQHELAAKTNLTVSEITNYEMGNGPMDTEVLKKIKQVLGLE